MTSPLRSLSITSWTQPPSEKSPSTSTGSGCTHCATPASSTMTWWGNTRRWSRTPATCCSWPGWRTRSASPPRPRAPGLQETWLPSSSTTSALFIRRSCIISIAWTSCSSITLYQPTSSLDEAGFHSCTQKLNYRAWTPAEEASPCKHCKFCFKRKKSNPYQSSKEN